MANQFYFAPLAIGGEHIDLTHLEPFTFEIDSKLAKKILEVHVTFSNHCFSRKYNAEKHPAGETIIDPTSRDHVCPFRSDIGYQSSCQLDTRFESS